LRIGGRDGKTWTIIAKPLDGAMTVKQVQADDPKSALTKSAALEAVPVTTARPPVIMVFGNADIKAAALIEVSDSPNTRALGMSNRESVGKDEGMFFDKAGSFWMKDVDFPLDIAFTDINGVILEKQSMAVEEVPWLPKHVYSPTVKAAHAIEMPLGWFDNNNIIVGDIATVLY